MDLAVLDTDVASLLHRGTLAGPLTTRLIGREPLITFVTFGELAKWAEIRNWDQRRREEPASWLSRIAVLPSDEAVAATWGRLSAAAIRRGDRGRSTTCGLRPAASPIASRSPEPGLRVKRNPQPPQAGIRQRSRLGSAPSRIVPEERFCGGWQA